MKKLIIVLSTISMILASVALLFAVMCLTFLWEPMCSLFSTSQDVIEAGPVLPVGNVISLLGSLIISVILFISSKKDGKIIVIEIISIILLSVVFPGLVNFLHYVQNTWIMKFGYNEIAALSITTNIMAFSIHLTGLTSSLCLITSGMRIAEKANKK